MDVGISGNHERRSCTACAVLAVGDDGDDTACDWQDPNPSLGDWVALAIVSLVLVFATMFGGVPPESSTPTSVATVLGPACTVTAGEPMVCR